MPQKHDATFSGTEMVLAMISAGLLSVVILIGVQMVGKGRRRKHARELQEQMQVEGGKRFGKESLVMA